VKPTDTPDLGSDAGTPSPTVESGQPGPVIGSVINGTQVHSALSAALSQTAIVSVADVASSGSPSPVIRIDDGVIQPTSPRTLSHLFLVRDDKPVIETDKNPISVITSPTSSVAQKNSGQMRETVRLDVTAPEFTNTDAKLLCKAGKHSPAEAVSDLSSSTHDSDVERKGKEAQRIANRRDKREARKHARVLGAKLDRVYELIRTENAKWLAYPGRAPLSQAESFEVKLDVIPDIDDERLEEYQRLRSASALLLRQIVKQDLPAVSDEGLTEEAERLDLELRTVYARMEGLRRESMLLAEAKELN
jgi:hypothetical protein